MILIFKFKPKHNALDLILVIFLSFFYSLFLFEFSCCLIFGLFEFSIFFTLYEYVNSIEMQNGVPTVAHGDWKTQRDAQQRKRA